MNGRSNQWALFILLGGFILLSSLILLFQPAKQVPGSLYSRSDSSIYNPKVNGCQAFYDTLRHAGILVMPWQKPFTRLTDLPNPAVMLLVNMGMSNADTGLQDIRNQNRLMNWVAQGNTLIDLEDADKSAFIFRLYPFKLPKPEKTLANLDSGFKASNNDYTDLEEDKTPGRYVLLPGSDQQDTLRTYLHAPILTRQPMRFQISEGEQSSHPAVKGGVGGDTLTQVLLEDEAHQPVMISFPWGKGKVILSSVGDLGANQYLFLKNDNFQFLSNLLLMERKPVYFNEFVLGYAESPDIFSYALKTPFAKIFAQLIFVFCFLLWISFKRWKPYPRQLPEEPPQPLTVFVQSLANIYLKSKSAFLVIAPILQRLEQTLAKRYRIEMEDTATLRQCLQDLFPSGTPDVPLSEIRRARQVVANMETLSPRETLSLIKQLSLIQERLEHHGFRSISSTEFRGGITGESGEPRQSSSGEARSA